MARKWTNENLPGALHFVTGNVFNRKRLFREEEYCIEFFKQLQALRTRHECKLAAFVLMPDHFHLVLNPKDGDIQTHTGILKSLSAKSIIEVAAEGLFRNGSENQVWQESFKALPLWSGWMIRQKLDYIHANPVTARLVKSAEDYRWTSFRAFYFEENDPLLQIDKEWWWPDDVRKLEVAMAGKSGGKPPS